MLELAGRLLPFAAAGVPVALATAIDVFGSSPAPAGTSMAVAGNGAILGSVSGGCVEQAALTACRDLLAGGPPRVQRFGFGEEAAARAGLACGGEVDVLVHRFEPASSRTALHAAAAGAAAALGFVVAGPQLGRTVHADRAMGAATYVDRVRAAPRMLVVGITETASALVAAATAAGYRVTVCDVRAAFVTPERFPGAVGVLAAAGHEVLAGLGLGPDDAVCVLGHDEDLDPLAIAVALEGPARYVGAIGSRATTARRRVQLADLAVEPARIARLRMPMGLDLGGRAPAETAIAVLAEVLAVRADAGTEPLRDGTGPIHRSGYGASSTGKSAVTAAPQ